MNNETEFDLEWPLNWALNKLLEKVLQATEPIIGWSFMFPEV
jgi:hypothetical protein